MIYGYVQSNIQHVFGFWGLRDAPRPGRPPPGLRILQYRDARSAERGIYYIAIVTIDMKSLTRFRLKVYVSLHSNFRGGLRKTHVF